jgi:hypothetical protein
MNRISRQKTLEQIADNGPQAKSGACENIFEHAFESLR